MRRKKDGERGKRGSIDREKEKERERERERESKTLDR